MRVYSVCEVLNDLAAFRNRTVLVKGRIETGRELSAISGIGCQFVTDGYTWPNYIWLSSTEATIPGNKPPWLPDWREVGLFGQQVRVAKERNLTMEATVEGMIFARAPAEYVVVRKPDGTVAVNGFGHLGMFPAMLFIKSIWKVDLRADPPTDANIAK